LGLSSGFEAKCTRPFAQELDDGSVENLRLTALAIGHCMRIHSNLIRLALIVVAAALIITGFGNFGMIGGLGRWAGSTFGYVAGTISILAGLCMIAAAAIKGKNPDQS
jgi:hypothetical protein